MGVKLLDQQRMNALLVKLEHASGLDLSDTIEQLLELSAPLDRVASIVERRVKEGEHVLGKTLATLLAKSQSTTLYATAARQQFKNDFWSLLILYKGKFPDVEIESVLKKKLYEIAFKDGEPLRTEIVDAMREVGSQAVLPTLQAIAYDLEPSAKVGKAFGNALGLIESLSAQARYAFLQKVLVAIEEIERRVASNVLSNNSTAVVDKNKPNFDDASNANTYKGEAEKFLGEYPPIVVHYVRKGAEALAKDVYRHLGLEKNGRPARRMQLDELINSLKQVKQGSAPDLLIAFLQTFQAFGNFASHDQDGDEVYLTNEIAEPIYKLYSQALILNAKWRNESQGGADNNE